MNTFADLEKLAETSVIVNELDKFYELANVSFGILKKTRAPLLKLSDYNKPGKTEGIKKQKNSIRLPDMKIIIVNGIPKIYSCYSN
jgi:hypothetical protein